MAAKDFTIKAHNGTSWDEMHPKTNMGQVIGLNDKISEVEAVAKGASRAYVFDTVAALDAWLAVAVNKAKLQIGDNLYVKAANALDYWWDGTTRQELETQKADLSNATAVADGLMSKTDKSKLDGIAEGATKVTAPSDIGAAASSHRHEAGDLNIPGGAGSHNSIYRGNFLGSSVTSAQYAAISSGTFDDLYIGDYWTINSVNYRIAAFDYFYRCGDTDLSTHHAVIVPDTALYKATMNATNVTTGGYVGSLMYTANLAQAKTTIDAAFSGHVMKHRQLLTNAVVNGKASGFAWFDSTVELMNELMVYGNGVYTPVSDGTTVPTNYTVSKSQLPLFVFRPDLISNRALYWLRDVITGADFAFVYFTGFASFNAASSSFGVRPVFSIF